MARRCMREDISVVRGGFLRVLRRIIANLNRVRSEIQRGQRNIPWNSNLQHNMMPAKLIGTKSQEYRQHRVRIQTRAVQRQSQGAIFHLTNGSWKFNLFLYLRSSAKEHTSRRPPTDSMHVDWTVATVPTCSEPVSGPYA